MICALKQQQKLSDEIKWRVGKTETQGKEEEGKKRKRKEEEEVNDYDNNETMLKRKMQMKQILKISHLTKPEKLIESSKTFRSTKQHHVIMFCAKSIGYFQGKLW